MGQAARFEVPNAAYAALRQEATVHQSHQLLMNNIFHHELTHSHYPGKSGVKVAAGVCQYKPNS
ncbi:hypothetical protein KCP69_05640 [Salmonella enterica subsp. enterica]|nr:hypothetical protein KCP69_05640 [Salmonella enterica subsp. enterica]